MKSEAIVKQRSSVKTLTKIAVLSAIATLLMLVDIPLWFAPNFYQLDFSEVPVLIGTFALGPIAGITIEFMKILLNFVLNGTDTGGIGELANFIVGCSFIVPAGLIYRNNKSVKNALVGMIVGTVMLATVGSLLNYFVLLPVYATIYGAPIDAFVGMGNALNKNIVDLKTLVLYAVVPFNLLKGIAVAAITLLVYKRISPILHK